LPGQGEYENRPKKRKQDFTRNRKMPFKKLIWFTLGTVKESSQNALERFFPKLHEVVYMSQQAFSHARQNVVNSWNDMSNHKKNYHGVRIEPKVRGHGGFCYKSGFFSV
jgi:hypothetical protein